MLIDDRSCSAVYARNGSSSAGSAVIAMIFIFYGVAGFAWPGLTISYVAEILPYNIRAKGVATSGTLTACASVFNQYGKFMGSSLPPARPPKFLRHHSNQIVNPIGLQNLQWKFYFVYIAILVIECLTIYFLFVETKGPTLEEIARIFDGDEAAIGAKESVDEKTMVALQADHVESI